MDELIRRFDSEPNEDLRLCLNRGVAYQANMSRIVPYDNDYFNKCLSYEDQEIAIAINAGRVDMVNRHVGADTPVVDIGVGSGEFIKKRPNTIGYDVNPKAISWLKEANVWCEDFTNHKAYTFWDVIEHVPQPSRYLRVVPANGWVFVSVPIFKDLRCIRESKHYRPNEHLYYWTEIGFVDWMERWGFELAEEADYEIKAGRDSILSFAFKRAPLNYHYLLGQYQTLHSTRYYGASAAGLYLDLIAPTVLKINPRSILDYGCGRSDLAAFFWNDGRRRIDRYDPAIPEYQVMSEGRYDLVFCCDVMEHILMRDVDRIFQELKDKSKRIIFVISLRPARARLPDGRNAHVTLLTKTEWLRWIESEFGVAISVPTPWDHVLMVNTFTV